MRKRIWFFEVAGILSVITLAALLAAFRPTGGGPASLPSPAIANAATAEVTIGNFTYGPGDLTIPAGTTVKWTNRDDMPHTVTSEDKVFASKALDTDDTFTFTFTQPGTYNYFCTIHPKMTAKVIVK